MIDIVNSTTKKGEVLKKNSNSSNIGCGEMQQRILPRRIILVRHGESQGNTDEKAYGKIADYKIPLTSQGIEQANRVGSNILDLVSENGNSENWKVFFYVSPYNRTRETLREIGRAFPMNRMIGVREECRVREQDFGNFQDYEEMKKLKETRNKFGRFFFRFPQGESGADVYDRVCGFLESLWRDIYMNRLSQDPSEELNIVIVSHGLAIRIFLMKWFKWTVEQFEFLKSPKNCEYRVMQLGSSGDYSLGINHDDQTLQAWGLSSGMIADQKLRAHGPGGAWNERSPSYLASFFDNLDDSDHDAEEDG